MTTTVRVTTNGRYRTQVNIHIEGHGDVNDTVDGSTSVDGPAFKDFTIPHDAQTTIALTEEAVPDAGDDGEGDDASE